MRICKSEGCGHKNHALGYCNLHYRRSKRCGDVNATVNYHGMCNTPEYNTWINMKSRCFDLKNAKFRWYGGAGVSMCREWRYDFMAFYEYIGKRPTDKHSIDRWPNQEGNYEPGNVRWADKIQQANNKKSNVSITVDGVTMSPREISEKYNINMKLVQERIRSGYSVDEIICPTNLKNNNGLYSLADESKYSEIKKDLLKLLGE